MAQHDDTNKSNVRRVIDISANTKVCQYNNAFITQLNKHILREYVPRFISQMKYYWFSIASACPSVRLHVAGCVSNNIDGTSLDLRLLRYVNFTLQIGTVLIAPINKYPFKSSTLPFSIGKKCKESSVNLYTQLN